MATGPLSLEKIEKGERQVEDQSRLEVSCEIDEKSQHIRSSLEKVLAKEGDTLHEDLESSAGAMEAHFDTYFAADGTISYGLDLSHHMEEEMSVLGNDQLKYVQRCREEEKTQGIGYGREHRLSRRFWLSEMLEILKVMGVEVKFWTIGHLETKLMDGQYEILFFSENTSCVKGRDAQISRFSLLVKHITRGVIYVYKNDGKLATDVSADSFKSVHANPSLHLEEIVTMISLLKKIG